ncbi:MAG: hypothetical protein JSS81_26375 [Acidobacteria bacterium]|nr:hypothetical protein [Acidobacteriota bacterium]
MKHLFLSTVLTVLILTANGFAQADRILANGNPPLTETVAARMQAVFEFALSRDFSADQAARLRAILIGYWRRDSRSDIENSLEYVKVAGMLGQLVGAQRETARQKLFAAVSDAVAKNPDDEMSRLLKDVYNSSSSVETPVSNGEITGGGRVPAALVGTWIARRGNGSGYVDPSTGATSGPNASVHSYTFYADGTFEYAILMQSSLYQCTTTINGYEAGAFEANDTTIGFATRKATKSYRDTCRPNMNSSGAAEIPAPKKLYYRFARDEQNNLNLCLADDAGRSSCFVKK